MRGWMVQGWRSGACCLWRRRRRCRTAPPVVCSPPRRSIAAWTRGLPNVRPPLQLDAAAPDAWPLAPASCRAVFAANLTHISPWAATAGLLRGAGRVLEPGGQLLLYGPFRCGRLGWWTGCTAQAAAGTGRHCGAPGRLAAAAAYRPTLPPCLPIPPRVCSVDGKPTTESNAAFDASLRARNPEWGYRDVGDVAAAGAAAGLALEERRAMPANNFLLVLRKG